MKDWASFLAAGLGLLFFTAAALDAGGQVAVRNPQWLIPGGLACWCLAWILAMLPRNPAS